MYRYVTPIAAILFTALAVTGCKAAMSVGAAGTPSAPGSPGASVAVVASASPLPSFSVPGTHQSVRSYQITSPVTTLDVTSHLGNITITGSTGNTVSVTEQTAYSSTQPQTTHDVRGGTLTLGYTCSAQVICGVAYVISVPSTVTITATTDAGAIRLSGLAGPMVTAKADAGLIDATAMSTAAASFTVDVGGVTATFTTAPKTLTAVTKAGGIALHVPTTVQYQINASTVAGKSTISVPQAAGSSHTITATSDVGAIQIAP
ncbi:MAG TPA: hypothetical protein VN969_06280 [Streptosporangiaceae bacterium]|nr:hypothetical protein [Streptosporangiaceae bacterium]